MRGKARRARDWNSKIGKGMLERAQNEGGNVKF